MNANNALPPALQTQGFVDTGDCAWLAEAQLTSDDLRTHAALLEDFKLPDIAILGRTMRHLHAKPGQTLIAEGDIGDWMLIILSGTVDVSKRIMRHDAQGKTTDQELEISRLAVLGRGAIVGEMSMLDGEPRNASCIALEEVQVGLLTRQAIAHLIEHHPAVGAKLLVKITQLLAQRLRSASNKVVKTVAMAKQDQK